MAQSEIGRPSNTVLSSAADAQNGAIAGARQLRAERRHMRPRPIAPSLVRPLTASRPTRAGRDVHATFRLYHNNGSPTLRIGDDGVGFDPAQTLAGAGLRNIHDRIPTMGRSVKLTSRSDRWTPLTLSLPWPVRHRDSRPRARGTEDRSARRPDRSDPSA